MQLLVFASVILSLSALAAADWVVITQYSGYTNCSTVAAGATAYPLNRCLPSAYGSSSTYYNYSASDSTTVTTVNYYSAKDCTGSSTSSTNTFGQCTDFGGQSYSYSATKPSLSGSVSVTDSTGSCGGSDPVAITYSFFDVCSGYGGTSVKYSYHGGGACVVQLYNSSDCSGAVESGIAFEPTCTSGVSSGCSVNGNILAKQTTLKTVTAGSQYATTTVYAQQNCTGPVAYSAYSYVSGCSGEGVQTSFSGNSVTVTFWDNANCTGYQIYSVTQNADDSGINYGQCYSEHDDEDNSDSSYKTTLAAYPTGSSVSIGFVSVDKCDNPTQIYAAAIYTPNCIKINNTASAKITCQVIGSNTTINSTLYASTDCTGKVIEADGDSDLTCSANIDYTGAADGTYNKYICNSVLPSSSTGKSTSDATPATRVTSVFFVVVAVVAMIAL